MIVRLLAVATALSLAACAGRPPTPVASSVPSVGKATPAEKPATPVAKGGGYYLDDGPGDNPPDNLDVIPDAVPRQEPLHRFANRPYSVLGRDYTPCVKSAPTANAASLAGTAASSTDKKPRAANPTTCTA